MDSNLHLVQDKRLRSLQVNVPLLSIISTLFVVGGIIFSIYYLFISKNYLLSSTYIGSFFLGIATMIYVESYLISEFRKIKKERNTNAYRKG